MMADMLEIKPPHRDGNPAKRVLTGRAVLFSLLAFFAVVASMNAVMITIALRTMPGVDVKSSYEASQNFNKDIARAGAQAARGWAANVDLSAAKTSGAIVVRFSGKNGEPVRGLQVDVTIGHPADRKVDRVLVLTETSPGQYTGRSEPFEPGARNLEIQARQNDREVFRTRERISL